jgi:hypothetical protein
MRKVLYIPCCDDFTESYLIGNDYLPTFISFSEPSHHVQNTIRTTFDFISDSLSLERYYVVPVRPPGANYTNVVSLSLQCIFRI